MHNLVIFDIDGTLVNSSDVDADCFVQSIEEVFGIKKIDTHWERYESATDAAIFEEIYECAFGRKPSSGEIHEMIENFIRLLRREYEREPARFREIEGAGDILRRLTTDLTWKPAIATGTWKEAALVKLQAAGLEITGIPLATASDEKKRESIILKCIECAKRIYRVHAFDKVVSVGDALWDLNAAKRLDISFIKIASAGTADYQFPHTLENFRDADLFMEYLQKAIVPC